MSYTTIDVACSNVFIYLIDNWCMKQLIKKTRNNIVNKIKHRENERGGTYHNFDLINMMQLINCKTHILVTSNCKFDIYKNCTLIYKLYTQLMSI